MRNLLRNSLFALAAVGLTACSLDSQTHYDSVSTHVDVDVVKAIKGNNDAKMFHRFQFDRDLSTVSNMTLYEAWIEPPEIVGDDEKAEAGDVSVKSEVLPFEMDMFRAFDVGIFVSENAPSKHWLDLSSDDYTRTSIDDEGNLVTSFDDVAKLRDEDVGDLREYMDDLQQFELEFYIQLEPFHLVRYWRDVCKMSDDCVMSIPLSMQFTMEE